MKALISAIAIFTLSCFSIAEARIGLLIGSMDPITIAHTNLVRAGVAQLNLNHLVIMINSSSDKDYSASVNERIHLTKIAIQNLALKISYEVITEPAEGKRAFAINLASGRGQGNLYQLAGEDVQQKAKELFAGIESIQTFILPRLDPGQSASDHSPNLLVGFSELTGVNPSSVSSTEVKQLLLDGQDVAHLLDPSVLQEIRKRKLYRPLSDQELFRRRGELERSLNTLKERAQTSALWREIDFDEVLITMGSENWTSVSTNSNVQFSRLQSDDAAIEVLIRRILGANRQQMTSQEQFQFRKWSLSVLNRSPCIDIF